MLVGLPIRRARVSERVDDDVVSILSSTQAFLGENGICLDELKIFL